MTACLLLVLVKFAGPVPQWVFFPKCPPPRRTYTCTLRTFGDPSPMFATCFDQMGVVVYEGYAQKPSKV